MSNASKELVACAKCGKQGEAVFYRSFNTAMDLDARERIESGSMFTYKCPHCGNFNSYDYGFLFHDVEAKRMIHYCTNSDEAMDAIRTFTALHTGTLPGVPAEASGYCCRVVMKYRQMVEKIYLFDQGLDDRVVEMMKVYSYVRLTQENPEARIACMYVERGEDGPEFFEVHLEDGNVARAGFSMEVYDEIKKIMDERYEGSPSDEYVINFMWAYEKLKEMNAMIEK